MLKRSLGRLVFGVVLGMVCTQAAPAADSYAIDAAHSSVNFKISHLRLSYAHGRFDNFSGGFTLDPSDPAGSSFELMIQTKSVDTNNTKRDDHLRSPDFFNARQFPAIKFKSSAVRPTTGGLEVSGDLTMHGVTKPVTFVLAGGVQAEFPKGTQRTGYSTDLVLKRSDFGIDKFAPMLGDKVYVSISFEGVKQ